MGEDHPGAYPHASAIILHFAAIPVTAHIDQNVVGLRLTVETRARRPKRRVPPGLTAIKEELDDVIGRSRQHDNLRDQPIRARIGGIPFAENSFLIMAVPSTLLFKLHLVEKVRGPRIVCRVPLYFRDERTAV